MSMQVSRRVGLSERERDGKGDEDVSDGGCPNVHSSYKPTEAKCFRLRRPTGESCGHSHCNREEVDALSLKVLAFSTLHSEREWKMSWTNWITKVGTSFCARK